MATQIQFRRGTTAGHSTFTGAAGEITIDTDKDTIIVHDGSTTGGANELVTLSNTQTLTNKTLTSPNMTSPSIGGTAVTATAAEINTLDGITATVSELNIMDGVTATTAEINKLDGVTATTTELNYVDVTTLGTSQASKAVTADANGDVTLSDDLSVGGNTTITGNLTVNGSTVTNSADNLVVNDALIELNNGATSNASDLGLIMERGSTGDNAFIGWDESADKFKVGTTTATGSSTGDLTIATGTMVANIEGNVTGDLTGNVTGDVTGDVTGNADTATTLETARTIGGVSFNGSANINLPGVNTSGNQDTSGNAATATALETSRTISLTGDASGSASFDGTANASISVTVADDSHNHVTGNIDGLAEYISDTVGAMVGGNTESGISVTYDDADNTLDFNVSDPTITLTGDVTGSATMTNLGDVSISTTVAANSVALGTDTTGNYMVNVSAGNGIDVSHTQGEGSTATVSIESDLRGDVFYIGRDTNDYYLVNTTVHDWRLDGNLDMRLENDGDLHVDGDVIAYSGTTSDERLKSGIMTISDALTKVNSLRGVEFTYKKDGKRSAGLIAQDVEKVLPQAVLNKQLPVKMGEEDETEYKVLEYNQTIGLLVEAIKELTAEVNKLKGE